MYSRALRPEEIETRSMEIIASLLPPHCCRLRELPVVMRMVHASGDPQLAEAIRFHPEAVATAVEALRRGADVVVDTQMVLSGVNRGRLNRLGGEVICGIANDAVSRESAKTGRTRAAIAMRLLADRMDGAVVAIGNAPTGLREVLAVAGAGVARPALVIGMPVGFVDAAESKVALMASDLVWISIEGTRGGSSLAAAAVNALLRMVRSS
ncbi:MAG: precorrin-8X methylmutase [Thermoleophilia bacterium]|nr:precorrin-8X methylmutase [Thermoleophilia bacterium]